MNVYIYIYMPVYIYTCTCYTYIYTYFCCILLFVLLYVCYVSGKCAYLFSDKGSLLESCDSVREVGYFFTSSNSDPCPARCPKTCAIAVFSRPTHSDPRIFIYKRAPSDM